MQPNASQGTLIVAREDEKKVFHGITTQHVLKKCCLPIAFLLYAEVQVLVTVLSQKCHILSQYSSRLLDHVSHFSILLSYKNYNPI